MEKIYKYWLATMIDAGIRNLERGLQVFGSARGFFEAPADEVQHLFSGYKVDVGAFLKSRDLKRIEREYDILKKLQVQFLYREDPLFPETLRHLYECPIGLFYKGKLPDENKRSIAVVGARSASPYGISLAESISRELAACGVQVISGLAHGIDAAAHRGVLEGNGETFAVLGCGAEQCYPKENRKIYQAILEHGGVISEYPPGSEALKWHFPMRNRIISGLSEGVLVVEARMRSGSLITAAQGLEAGKDIFAIPGRVTDALSAGCNDLIRQGAKLVNSAKDILEEYEILRLIPKNNNMGIANLEELVYSVLCLVPKNIDTIIEDTGLAMGELFTALINLEMNGYIRQIAKNQYVIRM